MHDIDDAVPYSEATTSVDDTPQRMAALDTERSFIVEASAGSGKTELLIQRYLKLLTKVDEPEQVLAITFTRKAAAEMRDRILQELRDAEANNAVGDLTPHKQFTRELAAAALEASGRKKWNLTRQPQRMNVRTIDSLCNEITARLPVLSRLGAATQPVTDASSLYSAAARAVLQQLGGEDAQLSAAIRTLLLHLDNRFEKATQLLASMLATRDQWGRLLPHGQDLSDAAAFSQILYDQFECSLAESHASACKSLQNSLDAETARQMHSLIQYAADYLNEQQRRNPFAECLSWKALPLFQAEHAAHWVVLAGFVLTSEGTLRKRVDVSLGFDTDSPRKTEMKALLEALADREGLLDALRSLQKLPPMHYTEQQREVLRASFLLLWHALAQLKIVFAQTRRADFTELLLAAQQALAEDTNSVALSLGTSIQHLLVDEMQDTSVIQFHLLELLVQSWDGYSQTVFLVGDPKQSIYRFRQAEVTLFLRARAHGLSGVQLEPISLTGNFRSQESLVKTTNEYFSGVFAHPSNADGIHFQPSLATNLEEAVERVHWHPFIHAKRSSKTEETATNAQEGTNPALVEAQAVCDVIERYRTSDRLTGGVTSIAVLVSTKRHAWPILKEMQQRKIPYRAIEMDTLTDRQPLLDLLAITRCLLHAADRIAWLAVLRAPWCGLTLADLHALCGGEDAQYRHWTLPELLRAHIAELSEDGRPRAERVWKTLETASSLLSQERLATMVERVWYTLGGPACIETSDALAIDQFLRMLDALENDGGVITAKRIEERMQKLNAPAASSGETSVEVLTIHKAKGLEWDVVLLPGLHNRPRNDDPKLLVWTEEVRTESPDTEESQLFLAPIQHATEEKEPISQWIRQRIARREEAERKRLFYVACTRAREELHLFATVAKNEKGEISNPDKRSLLYIAWPFAEEIFAQYVTSLTTTPTSNLLTMPQTTTAPESDIALAASGQSVRPAKLWLSNFRRLPSDWAPSPPRADVLSATHPEWIVETAGDPAPAFQRPEGSWKARMFGTVVHALLQPLASILRSNHGQDATEKAIRNLHRPTLLRLMQGGYAPKDALAAADRILRVLLEVSHDPFAQWLLAAYPNVDSMLPDFEIPLTALVRNAVRSVRLDRMFVAGQEPLTAGNHQLWIVDFKTATHGSGDLAQFLDEQKRQYTDQMHLYAEVVRAAYPQALPIHLGLYYPLLQKFIWWSEVAGIDADL